MKSKNNNISIGTPGAAALMIIFAVLCLAVFAVLSLSTVLADVRLADSLNAGIDSWYAADSRAEEILAALREKSASGEDSADGVQSFSVPISDTREIQVTAELDGGEYRILRWQSHFSGTRSPEEPMQVWSGD